jgi:hypothetical protein
MRMIAAGVLVSAALAAPATAFAQGDQQQQSGYIKRVEPREHERVVFIENVGYVPSKGLGYEDIGRAKLIASGQSTRLTVAYDPRHALNIDGGVIFMLSRSWGVGGTYTVAEFENLTIWTTPHVLGDASIKASGRRKEKTGRLELTRVLLRREVPAHDEGDRPNGYIIRAFGGPSYNRVKQHVVTYHPFTPDERDGSGWGYHGGVDFTMYTGFASLNGGGIGVGGTLRYSGGTVRLPGLLDSPGEGRPAGGWSFGGGLRFRM